VKIVGYETFLVAPRWQFLRIDTDEGISGWGEPIVEGRAEAYLCRGTHCLPPTTDPAELEALLGRR